MKLFLFSHLFAKSILLLLILALLYLLYKFPRKRFKKLSKLRKYKINLMMKYALKTKLQLLYNLFIIFSSLLIFVFLFFYLRLVNRNNKIDLIEKKTLLFDLIKNTTFLEGFLNFLIFLLFFFLYLILFSRLIKYIKFHFIKRHLYLTTNGDDIPDGVNWYITGMYFDFFYKYSFTFYILMKILKNIYFFCYFKYKKKRYPDNFDDLTLEEQFKLQKESPTDPSIIFITYRGIHDFLWFLIPKLHYLVIFFLLLYDVIFNNFQITNIFKFLPWILIYDLYFRFSKFIRELDIGLDENIHAFIYAKSLEVWDEKTLLIDGDFYDYERYKRIYKYYICNDFVRNEKVSS